MDEHAYRQRLAELQQRPCPFAQALLRTCVACACCNRLQIAEREVLYCRQADSHARCTELHDRLRHNFGFAIRVLDDAAPIPHGQEMRIQCGGLQGLSQTMRGVSAVADVDGLLQQVIRQWGSLEDIPYSAVVHAARECYKGRGS